MRRPMVPVAAAVAAAMAWTAAAASSSRATEPRPAAGQELGGRVLSAYLEMASALVADSTAGVTERAARIAADVGAAAPAVTGPEKSALVSLAAAAGKVTGKDVATLRERFKGFTKSVDAYLRASGTPGWSLFYCPMADGYWLQASDQVANPYFGKAMLRCGDKVERVEG